MDRFLTVMKLEQRVYMLGNAKHSGPFLYLCFFKSSMCIFGPSDLAISAVSRQSTNEKRTCMINCSTVKQHIKACEFKQDNHSILGRLSIPTIITMQFFIIAALAALATSSLAQDDKDIGCFVPGECVFSPMISITSFVESAEDCLENCVVSDRFVPIGRESNYLPTHCLWPYSSPLNATNSHTTTN